MATLWQQVVALDARYNAYRVPTNPQYRTLYMRRRSHLLRENSADPERDVSVRRDYIKHRSYLLAERYGPATSSDQGSIYSKAASISSNRYPRSRGSEPSRSKLQVRQQRLNDTDERNEYNAAGGASYAASSSIVPTAEANASKAMAGNKSLVENYAFTGMHHIFDQHKSAVVAVKFAHDDKSRVACCSYDGMISVMQVIPLPATVICMLKGHTSAVTDFDWSLSNDNILSTSLDGTVRLWEISSATCLRVYGSAKGPEILCCKFQPMNNNLFAIGKGNSEVQILNVSTGKSPRSSASKASGRVLSLCYDASGKFLWCSDDKGIIFSFTCDPLTGKPSSKYKKLAVCLGSPITSISARSWINREARDPCLLANCGIGAVLLLRINSSDGSLSVRKRFPIKQRGQLIRSAFCPLMSFSQGACIVTGSEDSNVYFFDIEKDGRHQCVNTLQGHSAPVLDVSFNYDESLLASCDANGMVIIWKRNEKLIS